jgi:hypothetical protein
MPGCEGGLLPVDSRCQMLQGDICQRLGYGVTTLTVLLLLVSSVLPVRAVSTPLPGEQDYYSADGRLVFGVTPRSDRADFCQGELFALDKGRLKLLWRHPLANRIAPGEVVVNNDGTVLTLDNWDSVGTGNTVVVVYGPDGTKRFNFELEQLLSEQEIHDAVYATSSSRWWRRDNQTAHIDEAGRRVIIATTAGVRAISLSNGAIQRLEEGAVDLDRYSRSPGNPKEEAIDSTWKYEVAGRLECMAECDGSGNWFIHLRPGSKFPQRLRLTVQDARAAQKARGKNVKAVVRMEKSGAVSAVRAYAESLTPRKSLSLQDLFGTPLRQLEKQH